MSNDFICNRVKSINDICKLMENMSKLIETLNINETEKILFSKIFYIEIVYTKLDDKNLEKVLFDLIKEHLLIVFPFESERLVKEFQFINNKSVKKILKKYIALMYKFKKINDNSRYG